MPTPPMPGWKLPVAVGWRSPIFSVAFTPSTARSCGDCSTFVFASLITACRSAFGTVVAQSDSLSLWRLERGTSGDEVLVVVVVLLVFEVLLLLAVPLLVPELELELELLLL